MRKHFDTSRIEMARCALRRHLKKDGKRIAGNDVTQNTRAAGAIRKAMCLADDADRVNACGSPFGDDRSE
jgi:hypothetical protein